MSTKIISENTTTKERNTSVYKMPIYPYFLSVVCIVQNQYTQVEQIAQQLSEIITPLVIDHEIIMIDNASSDNSTSVYQKITSANGIPNIQIYALTKAVDADSAAWVGIENALGDFVIVINPNIDDPNFMPTLLEQAVHGIDTVFAHNTHKTHKSAYKPSYRFAHFVFNKIYHHFTGIDLDKEAPQYRLLSKRVINYILQHRQPAIAYRHLPATAGFTKKTLSYTSIAHHAPEKNLRSSIQHGVLLLVSSTQAPMRLVTTLCLFGAGMNLMYSIYVVLIGLFKTDVAPGWISLSLQQSGMFFLLSLVLLVLGEYILNMATLSNEGPLYHVAQEFTSTRITRHTRINVEEPSAHENVN